MLMWRGSGVQMDAHLAKPAIRAYEAVSAITCAGEHEPCTQAQRAPLIR